MFEAEHSPGRQLHKCLPQPVEKAPVHACLSRWRKVGPERVRARPHVIQLVRGRAGTTLDRGLLFPSCVTLSK